MTQKTAPNRLNGSAPVLKRSVVSPVASTREFITFEIRGTAPMLQVRQAPEIAIGIFKKLNKIPFVQRKLTPEEQFLECIHVIGERPKTIADLAHTSF